MKTIYKVIITILVLLVLGIISITGLGSYFYISFKAENETARTRGVEFGNANNQTGCVDESLRQFREFKENTFLTRIEQMHITKFTRGCLTKARPVKDFCDAVPRGGNFVTRLKWEVDQCKKAGVDENGPCHGIYTEVIEACGRTKQETVSYPE